MGKEKNPWVKMFKEKADGENPAPNRLFTRSTCRTEKIQVTCRKKKRKK